jgi:hypothetical protein
VSRSENLYIHICIPTRQRESEREKKDAFKEREEVAANPLCSVIKETFSLETRRKTYSDGGTDINKEYCRG